MSTAARYITAEELFQMSGHERRELVKGELRTMAPAGFDHGLIIVNLTLLLGSHVQAHKLGFVAGAETGYALTRNPDTVRGADVSFVTAARVEALGRPKAFWPGAPDLAVEVLSPTDRAEEVDEKVDDYLAAGTRLVWVVNPKRRTVTVYHPGADPVIVRVNETLDGEDVVPGFRCSLAEVFA